MKERSRTVYVPAGLSSIFQICYEGNRDLELEGAKGGGFRLKLGTYTYAEISEVDEVFINGIKEEGKTSLKVIELFKKKFQINENIRLVHKIEVPIGCGFGTSGSGALGAVFAIADLFDIKAPYCELANIAHEAEILSLTGLGTVAGLSSFKGSCGLIIEAGGPCICKTKELKVDRNDVLVSIVISNIDKATVLQSEEKKKIVNALAEDLMKDIDDAYSLLDKARIFAIKAGFADNYLQYLMNFMLKIGFKGVAQNMIGKAVHGLIDKDHLEHVIKELSKNLNGKIVVSELQEKNHLLDYYSNV
jgi:pantoate kinase